MPNLLKRILFYKIGKFEINYAKLNPRNFKWISFSSGFKKFLRRLAFFIIFLGALLVVKEEISFQLGLGYYADDGGYEDPAAEEPASTCNVFGIELRGSLVTYISPDNLDAEGNPIYDESSSENIVLAIERADKDKAVKAIILEIDSYGGMPVAAEEVAQALKRSTKPTVALVRSGAASAAYWAATGANIIFASTLSDIGSIGATFSYVDSSKKDAKEGLTYNSLSTGEFKDSGDTSKPLTAAERELIMRDLNLIADQFIEVVAANRQLDINRVRELADGSSLPGKLALENGLIDRIGGMAEAKDYLKEKIGEDVELCW